MAVVDRLRALRGPQESYSGMWVTGYMRRMAKVDPRPDWRFSTFDLSLVHLAARHISKPCRLFKKLAVQMAPTLFPGLPT